MAMIGEHAVVLGGSVAGLLAARVLSDSYRKVTIVDRDDLNDDVQPRKGVPQARHAHLLQARGLQIIDELFPGVVDELAAGGAPIFDDGDLSRLNVSFGGHRLTRSATLADPLAVKQCYPSRPFLECHLRRRVRQRVNVAILDGHDIIALTATEQRDRVSGVRVTPSAGGAESTLPADLVVDAAGRGSRTPTFLEALGYGRPAEDEVAIHLTYVSQLLRIPAGMLPEQLVVVSPVPGRHTLMNLARYENGVSIFSVGGILGEEPPGTTAAMATFIEDFAPAAAVAAVRAGEPVSDVARYRFPSNKWRRYDKMRRFPQGLLPFGDAIASFNPIYGQGMTVAAVDAVALRDSLRRGEHELSRRFLRTSAKAVDNAWQMAAGSDLAYPEVQGPRSIRMRLSSVYTDKVLAAAETDPLVAERFIRAVGFVDPPTALLHPTVVKRVWVANWRRPANDALTGTANPTGERSQT